VRILGIDPGLRVTGYGVIEKAGQKLTYIASGVVRTESGELPARIKILFDGVAEILSQFQPDMAAVEKVFVNINPQYTLLLGQARGAAIAALTRSSLPVFEYTALQVKQAVVGNGHAEKEQVMNMVKIFRSLKFLTSIETIAEKSGIIRTFARGASDTIIKVIKETSSTSQDIM
jgi:crossover junction endodeoxyribonuclease RuvC